MKLKTILLQRLNKENQWVKDSVNMLLFVIISISVLSAASGGIYISSFATVIGTLLGIASASLSLTFSLFTGIVKKMLKATRD